MKKIGDLRVYSCNATNEKEYTDLNLNINEEDLFTDADLYREVAQRMSLGFHTIFYPIVGTMEGELAGMMLDKNANLRRFIELDSIDELYNLKDFDFNLEHFICLEKAIAGEEAPICFKLNGLLSFVSQVIDISKFLLAFRKKLNKEEIYAYYRRNVLDLLLKLDEDKVKLISLADSILSVETVGPKLVKEVVNDFYFPLINDILEFTNFKMHICPKLGFALSDLGLFNEIKVETDEMSYQEALINSSYRLFTNRCFKIQGNVKFITALGGNYE
ncbi:MAG: hypothetical protein PUG50_03090 [Eubacteriales bacterium]|uniref:hypothetical protein n=1 Tax=Fenollaria sp. TaxID=1965292 RepID=UPI002A75470B|nr:hypothetical protein [Fenollaria sp.]MDD7339555.1 hypothetical protein [Eubacteriales bacterium]MDY3105388.1 hypothetical protein [Fenollaria sp.]